MMWVGKLRSEAEQGSRNHPGRLRNWVYPPTPPFFQIRKLRCNKWGPLSSPEPEATESWPARFLGSHSLGSRGRGTIAWVGSAGR